MEYSKEVRDWCLNNASPAMKDSMSEDEIVEMLAKQYEGNEELNIFGNNKTESIEYISNETALDRIALVLSRAFGDKIAFKGGYMLANMIPDLARQTGDVDISIQNSELYNDMLIVMRKIGMYFVDNGYAKRFEVKPEIHERMSGGMKIYRKDGSVLAGLDIGWHDLTFGTTTTNISIGNVRSFTIERMLSDKITAILSKSRFRRPKDLYDVYCITNCFDFSIDVVNDFILKRTGGAGADWQNYPFNPTVLREYEKAYNSLKVYKLGTTDLRVKPEFIIVMNRFNDIAATLCSRKGVLWDHSLTIFKKA